jgi:hypothetical protein
MESLREKGRGSPFSFFPSLSPNPQELPRVKDVCHVTTASVDVWWPYVEPWPSILTPNASARVFKIYIVKEQILF